MRSTRQFHLYQSNPLHVHIFLLILQKTWNIDIRIHQQLRYNLPNQWFDRFHLDPTQAGNTVIKSPLKMRRSIINKKKMFAVACFCWIWVNIYTVLLRPT